MSVSRESRALRKSYDVFTSGVSPDYVIKKAYSEHWLTPDERERATQRTLTPNEQLEVVFQCLERRVSVNPSVFHKLVQVLLEEPALEMAGKKMRG